MHLDRYFTELEFAFNPNLRFWVTDYLSHLKMDVWLNLDHDNRYALCACLQYTVSLLQLQQNPLAVASAYLTQSPAEQEQRQHLQQWLDIQWQTQQNPEHIPRLAPNPGLITALSNLTDNEVKAYCPAAIYLFLATLYQIQGETAGLTNQHNAS